MKKFTAVVLALIVVLSSAVIAFAADIYTCPTCSRKFDDLKAYNDHIGSHETADAQDDSQPAIYECPTCHKKYEDLAGYNACIAEHYNDINLQYDRYIGVSFIELLSSLITIFNNTGIIDFYTNVFEKVFTFVTSLIAVA